MTPGGAGRAAGPRLPPTRGVARAAVLALLVLASTAAASVAVVAGTEVWLRLRPRSADERRLLDEGAAYGRLLLPARTPRLAALGWSALRPDTRATAGSVTRATNNLGFRDVPHERRKPPGTFRLVVIGDSYVYGQGVDDVARLYPRRLGVDRIDGREVDVVLLGLCGADLVVYGALFQDVALGLEPDAVLVSLVSNDFEDRTRPAEPCLPGAARRLLRLAPRVRDAAESRCNTLTRHYERRLREEFDPATGRSRRGEEAFAEMSAAARARGVDLLAFFFEFRPLAVPADARFRELAERNGVPYASLVPEAARRIAAGERVEDFTVSSADGHPNEHAHEVAARVATDLLRSRYPGATGPGDRRP